MPDDPLHAALRSLDRHRRLVTATIVAAAVVAAVSILRPASPPATTVWVAAHDLAGGQPLAAGDVRPERLPPADVPHDAVPASDRPVGRLLAAPVRSGEPLTDVRLLTPSLTRLAAAAGDVAVPVRVSDGPAALALVVPGDLVDVLVSSSADDPPVTSASEGDPLPAPDPTSTAPSSGPTVPAGPTPTSDGTPTPSVTAAGRERVVASRARVLTVSPQTAIGSGVASSDLSDDGSGLVILAVSRRTAQALADAAQRGPLSLAVEATGGG